MYEKFFRPDMGKTRRESQVIGNSLLFEKRTLRQTQFYIILFYRYLYGRNKSSLSVTYIQFCRLIYETKKYLLSCRVSGELNWEAIQLGVIRLIQQLRSKATPSILTSSAE